MYDPQTCEDLPSATSSLASGFGHTPCGAPDGGTTAPSGLQAVLANLSPRQARAAGLMTSAICGPASDTLSSSAALQRSLESRLRAKTQSLGSTLYKLTWKSWVTASGRSRSRLRASVRRTSETGSTGWPTPTAALAEKGVRTFEGGLLEAMRNHGPDLAAAAACLSGWPTTTSTDAVRRPSIEATTPNITLNHAANLAGWTTPTTRDWRDTGEVKPRVEGLNTVFGMRADQLGRQAVLAGWPTPNAGTPQSLRGTGQDPERRMAQGHQVNLKDAVRFLIHDQPARLTACGQLLTGSSAGMESGGQLAPSHSRWLMGLPKAWDECAPKSSPKSRKK